MRIVLHTGKGGVGKTTVSAMTAHRAAAGGLRTLLLSTDPAHSIADVLAVPVGAEATAVADRLWAAQVDTRGRFEAGWSAVREYLVGLLSARGMAEVQAEELTVLPGADEIVALLEVQRRAASGEYDVLVVDCAPSGETLRLLALPETVAFYADRLMGTPQRVLRTLAATLGRAPAARPTRDALSELLDDLASARRLLADPEITSVRLVLTPERVVIAEARRMHTALGLHGFPVDGVVVNRLLPRGAGGAFLARRRESEVEALALITESFGALPQFRVPMQAQEPIGPEALAMLAERTFGRRDPLRAGEVQPAISVEGGAGAYRMRLALPQVDRASVDLGRSGDELIVTVGAHRRRIALPSTLQRCRSTGARFDGDVLEIGFEPDPDKWPSSLAGSLPAPRDQDASIPAGPAAKRRAESGTARATRRAAAR